jgi:hypothetical protein
MKYPSPDIFTLTRLAEWELNNKPSFIELSKNDYLSFQEIMGWQMMPPIPTFHGVAVVVSEKE